MKKNAKKPKTFTHEHTEIELHPKEGDIDARGRIYLTVRLPREMAAQIIHLADSLGHTTQQVIRDAVRFKLGKLEADQLRQEA